MSSTILYVILLIFHILIWGAISFIADEIKNKSNAISVAMLLTAVWVIIGDGLLDEVDRIRENENKVEQIKQERRLK